VAEPVEAIGSEMWFLITHNIAEFWLKPDQEVLPFKNGLKPIPIEVV